MISKNIIRTFFCNIQNWLNRKYVFIKSTVFRFWKLNWYLSSVICWYRTRLYLNKSFGITLLHGVGLYSKYMIQKKNDEQFWNITKGLSNDLISGFYEVCVLKKIHRNLMHNHTVLNPVIIDQARIQGEGTRAPVPPPPRALSEGPRGPLFG